MRASLLFYSPGFRSQQLRNGERLGKRVRLFGRCRLKRLLHFKRLYFP
jgi:hypothetical protein